MKISTKGRYGAKIMIDIAGSGELAPILVKDISKRLNISEKYLGQLALMLKNAGLLNSVRGAKGGYLLSRPAADITLYDIVESLEGPICFADKNEGCAATIIWEEIAKFAEDRMREVSLSELVEMQRDLSQKFAYTI